MQMPRLDHRRPTAREILVRCGFEFPKEGSCLGSGKYSKVYKVYHKDEKRYLAVKVTDLKGVSSDFKHKFLPREMHIWAQVDHPNHVFLFKAAQIKGFNFAFMELAIRGDLLTYIQKKGALSEKVCQEWMMQLIDAVAYLHRMNVAHRDLKLENVLLFDGDVLKIGDYGFSKQATDLSSTYCGSKSYSAPEILCGTRYDIFKADIWSLGVMGFIMLTNSMPFREDVPNSKIVDAQRERLYKYPWKLSGECRHAIDKMMTFEPSERPSIEGCKSLGWFSGHSSQRHFKRPSLQNSGQYRG